MAWLGLVAGLVLAVLVVRAWLARLDREFR